MQCNILTFEPVIAMLNFIVFKRLILHMNIGRGTGVLFNFFFVIHSYNDLQ